MYKLLTDEQGNIITGENQAFLSLNGGGTEVSVAGNVVSTLNFTSDPQEQLDKTVKLNTSDQEKLKALLDTITVSGNNVQFSGTVTAPVFNDIT